MNTEQLYKFAQLLLDVGINIQESQNLIIRAEAIHWPFVNILEKAAYEKGVRFIRSDVINPISTLHRLTQQKEVYLDYIPPYEDSFIQTVISGHWSLIKLDGMTEPDMFENVDQNRNAIFQKAQRKIFQPLMKAFNSGEKSWTVSSLPTPKWAAKVLGGTADEANMEELWEILVPFLRLDEADPVAAWRRQADVLQQRCDALDRAALTSLRFKGPGTDVKIFLTRLSRWKGGAMQSDRNGLFFPNLPTEEVFTTPDFRKTDGRIAITKPLKVLNKTVSNARFEFKNGKVVAHDAESGRDALDQFFKMDPQARYLGEVALVGADSPIFKANKLFDSVILD